MSNCLHREERAGDRHLSRILAITGSMCFNDRSMVLLSSNANGWRRFYCPVCGHVEWVAPGEDLPEDYACPLCGVGRSTMIAVDDPRLARHAVTLRELVPGLWEVGKRPGFRRDYHHVAYVLAHPEGLVLYDAPPLVTSEAVEAIRALGAPRALVVSHCDFVGFAGEWGRTLGVPVLFGEGETPLAGNRLEPDERVAAPRAIFEDLELHVVPGHSPGSLALYWPTAPAGPLLCCGDAITVWPHVDRRTQVCFFQRPPAGPEIAALAARPVHTLATCMGALADAGPVLARLVEMEESCARPYDGETGGVWLDHAPL
jgi:rubredoxin